MKTKAQKWGNSLAVRVPKGVAEQAGVNVDDSLDIEVADSGVIVLTPLRQSRYRLSQLVKGITKGNVHDAMDFGKPVGREIW